ncbi:hypothetical protein EUTSA_v10021755mg [Eutrema salsugineum]|uniref:Transcription factor TFIIIC triple barrel domain-containing protein n=1 Tax=Eutrema salsugineum TaxID=72664 RepID=V4LX37_EUTSA|nr:uncharacterized protein LOC18023232 [Eutrema salsugineum]ESQ48423.1 hypothetical protein EUTSA_v10021755mg [Eutrema salsugineum]ESQ48424.1 hypothetical protein EUTSA_v10021755mg [Eutrema salsugineum]
MMNDESVKQITKAEAEYVLMDLGDVARHIDIPSNASYILSGMDTLNPVLTIDGKFKLVGEYTETIGTCLAFSEKEVSVGENQKPQKITETVGKLHKILKFRLAAFDNEDGETKATNSLKDSSVEVFGDQSL